LEGKVSNPHRYGQKKGPRTFLLMGRRRFQTLIGTVKSTVDLALYLPMERVFQTLIGTVKSGLSTDTASPFLRVSNPHRYGQKTITRRSSAFWWRMFQTLIGTVKSPNPRYKAAAEIAFQTLIGTVKRAGCPRPRILSKNGFKPS
jgi:hypothetical protein